MTTPLRYTRITGWALPLAFGGLVFALVGVWEAQQVGASAAPTTAFVASQSSQQAVSTKGFNRLAGVAR